MTDAPAPSDPEAARPDHVKAALARLAAARQARLDEEKQNERVRYAIVDPATGELHRWGYTRRRDLVIKPKADHHQLIELANDHPHPAGMVFDPVAGSLRKPT